MEKKRQSVHMSFAASSSRSNEFVLAGSTAAQYWQTMNQGVCACVCLSLCMGVCVCVCRACNCSVTPMATAFELPFQWDDGTFVSPYVATGDEPIAELIEVLRAVPPSQSPGSQQPLLRFVDLGCGDGRVAAAVARELPTQYRAAGYDLDDGLIAEAQRRYVDCGAEFHVADLTAVLPELLSHADILFMYLLPEAIQHFRGALEHAVQWWSDGASKDRGRRPLRVISHRWDVPFLDQYTIQRTPHLYVYGPPSSPHRCGETGVPLT